MKRHAISEISFDESTKTLVILWKIHDFRYHAFLAETDPLGHVEFAIVQWILGFEFERYAAHKVNITIRPDGSIPADARFHIKIAFRSFDQPDFDGTQTKEFDYCGEPDFTGPPITWKKPFEGREGPLFIRFEIKYLNEQALAVKGQYKPSLVRCPHSCHPLYDFFDSSKFSDVEFEVEGKRIRAHKIVLASKSDVFDTMFSTPLNPQRQESGVDVHIIGGSSFRVFSLFLRSLYGNHIALPFIVDSAEDALDIFYLSEEYNVPEVKKVMEQHVIQLVSPDTAVRCLIAGHLNNSDVMKEAAMSVIKRTEIKKLNDWNQLHTFPTLLDEVVSYLQKSIENMRHFEMLN